MKNRNKLYTGKVGAKMKPRTTISKRCVKQKVFCQDGPMKGIELWLHADLATMPMPYKGQTGRYVGGMWEAA